MIAIVAGIAAGIITTVSGMGGGYVLLLVLSAAWDPLTALAVSSPALLAGNLHRLGLYRHEVNRPVALRYAAGALPGAIAGGMLATAIPQTWLELAMVAMAVLAGARYLLDWELELPDGSFAVMGSATGFVAATGGAGGLIAGPFLLAAGLSGKAYVSTAAVGAIAVHVGRLGAYSAGGIVDGTTLALGAGVAVAVAGGNLMGDRVRGWLRDEWMPRVELGVVVLCVGLAVAGLR